MSQLRHLRADELEGPFETVAQLAHTAKAALERSGVELVEPAAGDEPGPTRAAAVQLDDGSQFLIVEHSAHPEQFLDLRAQLGRGTGREATDRFVRAVGLNRNDVTWVSPDDG